MHVAEIWRYPVKSMGGERLIHAKVGPLGIEGDRVVHVKNSRGRVVTARTHPQLLAHQAVADSGGTAIVDGLAWTDARVAAAIVADIGPGAHLVCDESETRFDVLPLLVATDGAIDAFGYESRRLRPNLVIGGVSGIDERTWSGRYLRIGDVLIALADLRARCVMTTIARTRHDCDHDLSHLLAELLDGSSRARGIRPEPPYAAAAGSNSRARTSKRGVPWQG